MRLPIAGNAAVLIALSIFAATGCTDDSNDSQIRSGTVVTDSGQETTTTAEATTSTAVATTEAVVTTTEAAGPASVEAESFKTLAPTITELQGEVADFVDATEATRIDQLAAGACGAVSADMTDQELGIEGLSAYGELSERESELIALQDWVVFYGALIGFFCPENLPEFDEDAAPLGEAGEVEGFRAIVTDVDGVSVETEGFVAALSDARIEELQALACAGTNPDMNTDDFGLSIVTSYGDDLSDAESDAITLSGYSEFYGALVGWFCPSNLPL